MSKHLKVLQFKVLIEQDEDGIYVASVPELPGCYTQGKTLEQVRERIEEAIELVLDSDKKIRDEKITAYISSVTEAELFSGKDIKLESKKRDLKELIGLFEKVILDNEIAQKSGEFRRNYDIETPDAIIAATAFHKHCKLLTKNKKDFQKIKEIEVEEPY